MTTTALSHLIAQIHRGMGALGRPATAVSFLRHAKAEAASGGHDSDRRINKKGKEQCAAAKADFCKMKFDAVYRSPLIRTADTLTELGANAESAVVIPELVVQAGLETHQSGVIDSAYEILGNCGLADIFKYSEVAKAMDEYAAVALSALYAKFHTLPHWESNDEVSVLVVGHGWLCPILAYYLAGTNEIARRHLLQKGMNECEIIRVGIDSEKMPLWNVFPCGW